MILVERVREIPVDVLDDLVPDSRAQWIVGGRCTKWAGDILVAMTSYLVVLRDDWDKPLAVVGVVPRSIINPPEVWMLLCNNLLIQQDYIKEMRRRVDAIFLHFPTLRTQIPPGAKVSRRFAEFFGFRPVVTTSQMITYEARNAIHSYST